MSFRFQHSVLPRSGVEQCPFPPLADYGYIEALLVMNKMEYTSFHFDIAVRCAQSQRHSQDKDPDSSILKQLSRTYTS